MSNLTDIITNLSDGANFSVANFKGLHLLQASAGTGKTYSIQSLYLRLLLVEGLTVQEILVLTFTRDATRELKDRLQKILREALNGLQTNYKVADARVKLIVKSALLHIIDSTAKTRQDAEREIAARLQLALLDFDKASISTIHGFCQRVLDRFAFETGQGFNLEPANDSTKEIEELCKDWWRKNIAWLDKGVVHVLLSSGALSFERIQSLAKKLVSKPDAQLLEAPVGNAGIQNELPQLMMDFAKHNLADLSQTAVFMENPVAVKPILEKFYSECKTCIEVIRCEKWGEAFDKLRLLSDFSENFSIDKDEVNRINNLHKACQEFCSHIPSGTRGAGFLIDGGFLRHERCPDLSGEDTARIGQSIAELDVENLLKKYRPVELEDRLTRGKNKGDFRENFKAVQILMAFFESRETVASEVYNAIKEIAKNGVGIHKGGKVDCALLCPAIVDFSATLISSPKKLVEKAALEIKEKYFEDRASVSALTYDDLLINLRDALKRAGDSGAQLVNVLREEFRAALIDEFQDTDPVQWEIFSILFATADIPCFLVGDPKQAIYRFRNGDIETYQKATKVISDKKYVLDTNYRSEKRLVEAINQIFMRNDSEPLFGEGIPYEPIESAGSKTKLLVNGKEDKKPFKILTLPCQYRVNSVPGKNSESAHAAYIATASEIADILNDGTLQIEESDSCRPVRRSDIAVLVRTHDEAEKIASLLRIFKIPAVRQGSGNVWDTEDGRTMFVFLDAILDPRNLSKLKQALLSDWEGVQAEKIVMLDNNHAIFSKNADGAVYRKWEDYVFIFEELSEIWLKRGFAAMFRQLNYHFDIKRKMLSRTSGGGQRRIANMNHIAELIEKKIRKERVSPEGILSWIKRQFVFETKDTGEEMGLRLESDDDAIRINTLFVSKGLEYPIVFAPTLFMMNHSPYGNLYECHDADGALKIALKHPGGLRNASTKLTEIKEKEKDEVKAEFKRQIYVALTRAANRIYTVALDELEGYKTSVFGVFGEVMDLKYAQYVKIDNSREIQCTRIDRPETQKKYEQKISGVKSAIEFIDAHKKTNTNSPNPVQKQKSLELRNKPEIDKTKGHSSFSSLILPGKTFAITSDVLAVDDFDYKNRDAETYEHPATESYEEEPLQGIFAFPAGAKTGTCWHEVFEDIAFDAGDDVIRTIVEEKLRRFGFLKNEAVVKERVDVVSQMVSRVLSVILPAADGAGFALNQISEKDRRNEWQFSFSALAGQRTKKLRESIENYEQYTSFTKDLAFWEKDIPAGYMTGFVDLLFRKDNRYYIVDWKSNRRGGRQSDFSQAGLREEICQHRYWLQYLIYSVAVHQFLSSALPEYSYEEHFGGVYYIFLRGVDGMNDSGSFVNGIYSDRPPFALIESLSAILGDFR